MSKDRNEVARDVLSYASSLYNDEDGNCTDLKSTLEIAGTLMDEYDRNH